MPAELGEETYSVSGLCTEIQEFFRHGYPPIWVAGELQRVRVSQRGHAYFELVEKGQRDEILGKLDGVIWRSNFGKLQRKLEGTGEQLTEGQQVRCLARLDFYGPSGRLQLVLSDVDPVFTLGKLEQKRRETLASLEARQLLDANRKRHLGAAPLRVGLVTSQGSAAYHDFFSALRDSPYGFEVVFVHSEVQGPGAAASLASAISALPGLGVECTAVIRGGGARSDLASFDQLAVAEAIAQSIVPVVTGLGHENDDSICDRVAHTRARTPTGAAEFLIDRVRESDLAIEKLAGRLRQQAIEGLHDARQRVERSENLLRLVSGRVASHRQQVEALSLAVVAAVRRRVGFEQQRLERVRLRLVAEAPRFTRTQAHELQQRGRWIVASARSKIRWTQERIDGQARLCQELSPQRVLERGFSITRGTSGRVLRSASEAQAGETVTTELEDGRLVSVVEKVE